LNITIKVNKKYVNFWNSGFTLVEALLGLAAFCLLAALLPVSFQVFSKVDQGNSRLQTMQWEVFSSQVKKEIRMSQKINPQVNKLFLTRETDSILYEKFGTNVRRRVNLTGNEILLQNVKSIQFDSIKNGTIVKVEDIWSRKYSFTTRSYINTTQ
jgi:competence protein ComGF